MFWCLNTLKYYFYALLLKKYIHNFFGLYLIVCVKKMTNKDLLAKRTAVLNGRVKKIQFSQKKRKNIKSICFMLYFRNDWTLFLQRYEVCLILNSIRNIGVKSFTTVKLLFMIRCRGWPLPLLTVLQSFSHRFPPVLGYEQKIKRTLHFLFLNGLVKFW